MVWFSQSKHIYLSIVRASRYHMDRVLLAATRTHADLCLDHARWLLTFAIASPHTHVLPGSRMRVRCVPGSAWMVALVCASLSFGWFCTLCVHVPGHSLFLRFAFSVSRISFTALSSLVCRSFLVYVTLVCHFLAFYHGWFCVPGWSLVCTRSLGSRTLGSLSSFLHVLHWITLDHTPHWFLGSLARSAPHRGCWICTGYFQFGSHGSSHVLSFTFLSLRSRFHLVIFISPGSLRWISLLPAFTGFLSRTWFIAPGWIALTRFTHLVLPHLTRFAVARSPLTRVLPFTHVAFTVRTAHRLHAHSLHTGSALAFVTAVAVLAVHSRSCGSHLFLRSPQFILPRGCRSFADHCALFRSWFVFSLLVLFAFVCAFWIFHVALASFWITSHTHGSHSPHGSPRSAFVSLVLSPRGFCGSVLASAWMRTSSSAGSLDGSSGSLPGSLTPLLHHRAFYIWISRTSRSCADRFHSFHWFAVCVFLVLRSLRRIVPRITRTFLWIINNNIFSSRSHLSLFCLVWITRTSHLVLTLSLFTPGSYVHTSRCGSVSSFLSHSFRVIVLWISWIFFLGFHRTRTHHAHCATSSLWFSHTASAHSSHLRTARASRGLRSLLPSAVCRGSFRFAPRFIARFIMVYRLAVHRLRIALSFIVCTLVYGFSFFMDRIGSFSFTRFALGSRFRSFVRFPRVWSLRLAVGLSSALGFLDRIALTLSLFSRSSRTLLHFAGPLDHVHTGPGWIHCLTVSSPHFTVLILGARACTRICLARICALAFSRFAFASRGCTFCTQHSHWFAHAYSHRASLDHAHGCARTSRTHSRTRTHCARFCRALSAPLLDRI